MIYKPTFLTVEEDPSFVRDTSSNAILASNLEEKRKFLENQRRKQEENNKVGNLESRVLAIESGMNDIKNLLNSMLNKRSSV